MGVRDYIIFRAVASVFKSKRSGVSHTTRSLERLCFKAVWPHTSIWMNYSREPEDLTFTFICGVGVKLQIITG